MQKIAVVLAIAAVGEGLIAFHLFRQLRDPPVVKPCCAQPTGPKEASSGCRAAVPSSPRYARTDCR